MPNPLDMPFYEVIARAMAWQAAGTNRLSHDDAWAQTPEFEKVGYMDLARSFLTDVRVKYGRKSQLP